MNLCSLREHPGLLETFISYFQQTWANPDSMAVYEDCMRHAITTDSPLPQWYLLTDDAGETIIGCAGLITNDFISRMDLWPWLAALIVEEEYRGNALGSVLIRHAREHAASLGFDHLYLATDHIGYYEKYGFAYIADGYHPWGESSRIYRANTHA